MSEQIQPQALKRYAETMMPNMVYKKDDALMQDEKHPVKSVMDLIHVKAYYIRSIFEQENSGADPEIVGQLLCDFFDMVMELEAAQGAAAGPEKDKVIEVFAPCYHMLTPGKPVNDDLRKIFEKTFEALELGPIPPAKFSARLTTKKLEGPATNEGMSL